ncbi:MAG: hypothetical protein ACRDPC_26410 [Solirubrobacteraceae bacterium]
MTKVVVLSADGGRELPIVADGGFARAIVSPEMGAELRSLHRIRLRTGGETIPLRHASDAVYYVVGGEGTIAEPDAAGEPLVEGSMAHVDAGTHYVIRAGGPGLDIVGGPAPADHALYDGVL